MADDRHQNAIMNTSWGAVAYDWFTALGFLGRRAAIYDRMAREAGIQPGDRVLDLGCGPGTFTRAAARLAGGRGQVVGLDSSLAMVRRARKLGGIYHVGDAAHPRFPDGNFDVIISSLALHHVAWADRDAVFTQAYRMLRPGGRLLFCEFVPPFGRVGMAAARGIGEQMVDDPRSDLVDRMARAGFDRIEERSTGVLAVVRSRRP